LCTSTEFATLANIFAGIPELDIVPMDPLNIPRLEYREGNQNYKMQQVLSNVTIYGIGDGKLLDVRSVLCVYDTSILKM
jgi:hypothetical protein